MDIAAGPTPEAPVMHGQRIDWTPRDVFFGALFFLGLFLLVPILPTIPFYVAFGEDSSPFYLSNFAMNMVAQVGIVAVAAHFTFRKYGGGWERLGVRAPSRSTWLWAAGALFAALVFAFAYGGIIEALDVDALKSECDDQVPDVVLERRELLIAASLIALAFAPICEELFFRGFIFTGLTRWGFAVAVLLSAAIFSSAHIGPNLHKTFIPILGIGAIFAFTYLRSGNILSTMTAHFAWNIFGVIGLWACDP